MKVFVIFLCIAIGHAFGDLQRVEIRKDELKAREDEGEALSPNVKETVDPYLQSKDVPVPTQSSSSNETATDANSSSLVMRSPVRSVAHEGKKNGQKAYLEAREADIRSQLNHSDRLIFGEDSITVTSFTGHHTGKDFANNTSSIRRKRDADSFNNYLEPAFAALHPEEYSKPESGGSRAHKGHKKHKHTKSEKSKQGEVEALEKSVEKQTPQKKEESVETKTPEKKEESVEKKTPEKKEESVEKKTTEEKGESVEKKTPQKKEESVENKTPEKKEEAEKSKEGDKSKEEDKSKEKATDKSTDKGTGEDTDKVNAKYRGKDKSKDTSTGRYNKNKDIDKNRLGKDGATCEPTKIELTDEQIDFMLEMHNEVRRREKATNMLKIGWDEACAKMAQIHANTCKYGHKMIYDCDGRGLGQSIWSRWNLGDNPPYIPLNITMVVYNWADEYVDWDWSTLKCNPGKECGHWQMATSAKTPLVGCGFAKCPSFQLGNSFSKNANYVVCNYWPYALTFERGERCANCRNTTSLYAKGYKCETELCVQCDPKEEGCKPVYLYEEMDKK